MTAPTVPLGEVVAFKGGGTPSRGNKSYWGGAIPWATVKDFNSGTELRATLESITPEGLKNSASNVVPAGTLVIPTRMALGKAAITEVDIAINQDLKAVIPDARVDRRYLLHYFIANRARIEGMGKGATVKGITLDQLRAFPIPLPPLAEQRRIAAILDKADALRAKRREAIARLDQLLQSVFLDMFGDPASNPGGFTVAPLGHIALQITDGAHHTPVRSSQGIPLLSARNVLMGEIDFSNTDFVETDEYERLRKRCEPLPGDILISCSGSIGRVAAVDTHRPFVLVRSAALVKLDASLASTAFMEHQLRTPALQAQMRQAARSSSQANLFQDPIRKLCVIVPPLDLQRRFERVVFAVRERRRSYVASQDQMSTLFSSLQSNAFRPGPT